MTSQHANTAPIRNKPTWAFFDALNDQLPGDKDGHNPRRAVVLYIR
jgi:hypothetical protein